MNSLFVRITLISIITHLMAFIFGLQRAIPQVWTASILAMALQAFYLVQFVAVSRALKREDER